MLSKPKKQLVLLGSTGAGKSSLGNQMVGSNVFPVGDNLISQTSDYKEAEFLIEGIPAILGDTKGFADNRAKMKESLTEVLNYFKISKRGIDLFLFCAQPKLTFDAKDIDDVKKLHKMFAGDMYDNLVIVVTQLDRLNEEERNKVIELYKNKLAGLLKTHGLKLTNRILFPTKANFPTFIQELKKILLQKEAFSTKLNIDLNDPIKAYKDPTIREAIEPKIDSLKDSLKGFESIKEKDSDDLHTIELIQTQLHTLEFLAGNRGSDLKAFLKSIENTSPFCKALSSFFLSTKKKTSPNFFSIAYDLMVKSVDPKKEYSRKECGKLFQDKLNNNLIPALVKALDSLLNKHSQKKKGLEASQGFVTKDSSNILLEAACAGGLGLGSGIFAANWAWVVSGTSAGSFAFGSGVPVGAVVAEAGIVTTTATTATGAAVTTLSALSLLGVGVLVFAGIFAGVQIFKNMSWTKEGLAKDMTLSSLESFLKSDICIKFILTCLIAYCDL